MSNSSGWSHFLPWQKYFFFLLVRRSTTLSRQLSA